MDKTGRTSAALARTTLDRLMAHGKMGDSVDSVINRLLDQVEELE